MASFNRIQPSYRLLTCLLVAAVVVLAPSLVLGQETKPAKPADFKQLQREFRGAYKACDYPKALGVLEKMHEQQPKHVETLYNLACVNCLLGQKDKAYDWLEEAVKAGYKDVDHLVGDDDFKTIRGADRFRALAKRMRDAKLAVPSDEPRAKPEDKPAKPAEGEKTDKSEAPKKPAAPAKPEKPEKPEKPAKKEMSEQQRQQKADELTGQIVAASQKKQYEKGLKLALQARELVDNSLTNYNVACMFSGVGEKDKAFKHLEKSLDQGGFAPDMAGTIENDADFDNIRDDPRYAKIIEKAGGETKKAEKPKAPAKPEKPEKPEKPAKPDAGEKPAKKEMSAQERQQKVNELTGQAVAASQKKEYEKGMKLALQALELADNSLTNYNVACMYSCTGKKDKAFKHLEKSLDQGGFAPDMATTIENDADFDNIRDDPRYAKIIEKAGGETKKAEKPKTPAKPEKPEKPEKPDKPAQKELSEQEALQKALALTQDVVAAAQEGKPERALKLALQALELADIGLTNYNVACMYSLLDKKDEAFKYLDKAIELGGFTDDLVSQIESDTDFDNIRKDARYAKAVEKAGGKPAKAKAEPGKPKPAPAQAGGQKVDFQWKTIVPKKFDKSRKAPLIVALHGRGSNLNNAGEAWSKAAAEMGAILVAPGGTLKLGDGKFAWGRDLDQIEENIMDAINKVMDEYKIDEDRVVIVGFSEGAYVAWQLGMRNADAFRGIVPVAGILEWPNVADVEAEDVANLRVCIMVGGDDRSELVGAAKAAAKKLEEAKAKVRLNVYEDVGHDLPKNAVEEQVKALKFILGD